MKQKWILHGEETYNLAPFEYPWAFTMAQSSLANHWTPHEIPMGMDKSCYDLDLTDDERYLFRYVFASLTTADLAIQENLTARVYGMIKAAEIRLYISRQIAEEGLHSVSYQHIIEVLGLDQAATYSLYKQVPEIAEWFAWSKNVIGASDILIPLIFYYAIFEGIFFPAAFAAIYSLHRRRLMSGSGQQIQYIHRDETAHTGFGIRLINEIVKEQQARPSEASVHQLFKESMKLLDGWGDRCIPPILGYSAELHKAHSRFLADRRLKALGYQPLYNVEEALPWLDEMASIKKEKNFFESRVTDYQSGVSLKFDDNASMDDIMSWRG